MDFQQYIKMMQTITKLSRHGWTYISKIENGNITRTMIHPKHGGHSFNSWFKLRMFVEKKYSDIVLYEQ